MPTYNVLVGVVDLIDAPTPTDAINQITARLSSAGYDVYGDGVATYELPSAFLSDVDTEGNPQ